MRKKIGILIGLVLLKLIIQFQLIGPWYDLHRDEYLHIDQGHHPAWGYLSVPPLSGWLSWMLIQTGLSDFGVHLIPALFGAATLVVVWKATELLGGSVYACVLGVVAVLFSSLFRMNLLYQPNSADIFFWTLVYYFLLRFIREGGSRWLYAAAISLAFGILNKYNIGFLVIGLLPALLISYNRNLFSRRAFYGAMLFCFVLVLPNLVWQWQHQFPVWHHMQELTSRQLEKVDRADYLKEQLLYFLGSVFLILLSLYALAFYKPFRPYRFLLWSFVFTHIVFICFRAKGYYAVGLYPVHMAFGAVFLDQLGRKWWMQGLRVLAVVVPILLFVPLLTIVFPVASPQAIQKESERYRELGLLRWEDGKEHHMPQDFADMLGWKEMAALVDSARRLGGEPEHTLVACDNYGQAGAVNYYSRTGIPAVSLNADYINWFPTGTTIRHVILVKEVEDDDTARIKEQALFRSVSLAAQVKDSLAREFGTRIYLLEDAKVDVMKLLEEERRRKLQ